MRYPFYRGMRGMLPLYHRRKVLSTSFRKEKAGGEKRAASLGRKPKKPMCNPKPFQFCVKAADFSMNRNRFMNQMINVTFANE